MNQEFLMVLAPVISTLLINIFMLVGILAAGYIGWKEMISAKKESAMLKKDAQEKAARITALAEKEAASLKAETREWADQILAAAQSAAASIIQKSNILGTQFQESLKAEFQKTIEKQISAYKETAQSFESKSEAAMASLEGIAREDIKETLKKFGKALEQDELKEHEEIERELQKYRDQKIAEMDEYAKKTLSETLTRAVGDALTKEQHETLVMEALKKLKETNFFQHA